MFSHDVVLQLVLAIFLSGSQMTPEPECYSGITYPSTLIFVQSHIGGHGGFPCSLVL